MILRHKFRLYPTQAQEDLLWQFCGAQRFVWNWALAREIETYEQTQKFNFVFNNNKELTKSEFTSVEKEVVNSFDEAENFNLGEIR